jgi:hypothetical protein
MKRNKNRKLGGASTAILFNRMSGNTSRMNEEVAKEELRREENIERQKKLKMREERRRGVETKRSSNFKSRRKKNRITNQTKSKTKMREK